MPADGDVLGIGLETGLIAPIGETDVIPIQVRMFNGGENTVRSFREDELGRIAPGYRADLTVLDLDPTACAPEELLQGEVLLTIVAGEVRHERGVGD